MPDIARRRAVSPFDFDRKKLPFEFYEKCTNGFESCFASLSPITLLNMGLFLSSFYKT